MKIISAPRTKVTINCFYLNPFMRTLEKQIGEFFFLWKERMGKVSSFMDFFVSAFMFSEIVSFIACYVWLARVSVR